jgi:hypothetical protein
MRKLGALASLMCIGVWAALALVAPAASAAERAPGQSHPAPSAAARPGHSKDPAQLAKTAKTDQPAQTAQAPKAPTATEAATATEALKGAKAVKGAKPAKADKTAKGAKAARTNTAGKPATKAPTAAPKSPNGAAKAGPTPGAASTSTGIGSDLAAALGSGGRLQLSGPLGAGPYTDTMAVVSGPDAAQPGTAPGGIRTPRPQPAVGNHTHPATRRVAGKPLAKVAGPWQGVSLKAASNLWVPIFFGLAVALFIVLQALVDRRDPKVSRAPERGDDDTIGFR